MVANAAMDDMDSRANVLAHIMELGVKRKQTCASTPSASIVLAVLILAQMLSAPANQDMVENCVIEVSYNVPKLS